MMAEFSCSKCLGRIEMEAEHFRLGAFVMCPHCREQTQLRIRGNPLARRSRAPSSPNDFKIPGAVVMALGGMVGGLGFGFEAAPFFWAAIPIFLLGLALFVAGRFKES